MDSYNFGFVLAGAFGIVWPRQKIDLNTRDMRLTFALGARRQNKNRKQPHTPTKHTHTQYTHQAHIKHIHNTHTTHTLPRSQSSKLGSPPFGFDLGFWLVFLLCTHSCERGEYRVIILLLFFSFFLFYFILFYIFP